MARIIKKTESNTTIIQTFLASQQSLMLILGSQDNIKSELLTEIIKNSRASQNIIRMQGSPVIKPNQLAALLSKNWQANISDDTNLKIQLEEILFSIAKNNLSCLLVIDDADSLSYSVLAALSYLVNLQENREVRLHIILSGKPILNEKINNCEMKKPPYINLDDKEKKNIFPQFLKKHAIKSVSIIALIFFTFFIHWFDQNGHNYIKIPGYDTHSFSHKQTTPTMIAKNKPAESNIIKPSIEKVNKKNTALTSGYIIQLMSDPNKEVLTSFIDEYHINDHVKIVKNYFHHHNWYLLAYGDYSSYHQAKKALKNLPKNLKALHPWIRPEKDINQNKS